MVNLIPYLDDIALQFTLMYENTIQNFATPNHSYSGLMYHGYDYSHRYNYFSEGINVHSSTHFSRLSTVWADPDRGHSPEIWDRALGWYSMALVDALAIIPTTHPGHATLLTILRTLVPRIAAAADPTSGVWWLVITQPGRAQNYFESSGASMFVYSLLKAVRVGYVSDPDGKIVAAAKKAYSYIVDNWVVGNGDGTMNWLNTVQVGSLNTDGSFEASGTLTPGAIVSDSHLHQYYVSVPTDVNDLKGLAAFALASIEFEHLEGK